MRLTDSLRRAFVAGVLGDLPVVPYTEQIAKLVQKAAIDDLPSTVRAIYDDPKTRDYVGIYHIWDHEFGLNHYVYQRKGWRPKQGVLRQIVELRDKANAQQDQRNELAAKLRSLALSVTTTQALAALAPEFAKYVPKDPAKTKQVPAVVTDVLAELKASGWPEGKEPEADEAPANGFATAINEAVTQA